jgi:hypothetical protein
VKYLINLSLSFLIRMTGQSKELVYFAKYFTELCNEILFQFVVFLSFHTAKTSYVLPLEVSNNHLAI